MKQDAAPTLTCRNQKPQVGRVRFSAVGRCWMQSNAVQDTRLLPPCAPVMGTPAWRCRRALGLRLATFP